MASGEPKGNIPVLLGARRLGRRSDRVARFVLKSLAARAGIETELIDLAVVDLPILRERPDETDAPPPSFPSFRAKLAAAAGLVIVTPADTGGCPGVLQDRLHSPEAG